MKKADLRSKYKALRALLSNSEIENQSLAIANQLLSLTIWDHSFYHLFLTIETQQEINTDYILNILAGKDKNIVISKSNFSNNTLSNFLLTDATTLKLSTYNIPEPIDGIPIANTSIDVVFVPLLAFDLKGNRVGYGKGFYDIFLSSCRPETIKIGLSVFPPEDKITDIKENDIALDYCVTPDTIYSFSAT